MLFRKNSYVCYSLQWNPSQTETMKKSKQILNKSLTFSIRSCIFLTQFRQICPKRVKHEKSDCELVPFCDLCHQYFLITISSTQYTPVSSWSNRPLLSGVTAVVHGCSVHVLGHNLGEEIAFIVATLQEGTWSSRNYTRLHSWTIYCKILSLHIDNPPLRVGTSSHGYCQTQAWNPAKHTIN